MLFIGKPGFVFEQALYLSTITRAGLVGFMPVEAVSRTLWLL
ncbi:MAG: hypothetical protein QXX84_02440 [Sulfolobales archaeon]|jgi:hypothetical protein